MADQQMELDLPSGTSGTSGVDPAVHVEVLPPLRRLQCALSPARSAAEVSRAQLPRRP